MPAGTTTGRVLAWELSRAPTGSGASPLLAAGPCLAVRVSGVAVELSHVPYTWSGPAEGVAESHGGSPTQDGRACTAVYIASSSGMLLRARPHGPAAERTGGWVEALRVHGSEGLRVRPLHPSTVREPPHGKDRRPAS